MDSAYDNAVKRKKELESELAEIDQFLALYHRFSGRDSSAAPPAATRLIHRRFRTMVNPSMSTIAGRAAEILKKHGRPMQRSELVKAIEESGMPLQSEDKPRYLGTILWRSRNVFENIEGRGYWLKGEPLVTALFPENRDH